MKIVFFSTNFRGANRFDRGSQASQNLFYLS
jgi:hypothetical protein